jgi:hypothetical protein
MVIQGPCRRNVKTDDVTEMRTRAAGCVLSGVALALSVFLSWPSRAQDQTMPPALQVALFRKIFPYDNRLAPPFKILIVYVNDFAAMASEIQKRFEKLEQAAETASVADFSRKSKGANVVYVLSSTPVAAVKAFCLERHVLSVSPFPSLAEQGEVSIAVGVKQGGQPEIVVHLARSKSEGQDLQMPLLSLARVIR